MQAKKNEICTLVVYILTVLLFERYTSTFRPSIGGVPAHASERHVKLLSRSHCPSGLRRSNDPRKDLYSGMIS